MNDKYGKNPLYAATKSSLPKLNLSGKPNIFIGREITTPSLRSNTKPNFPSNVVTVDGDDSPTKKTIVGFNVPKVYQEVNSGRGEESSNNNKGNIFEFDKSNQQWSR